MRSRYYFILGQLAAKTGANDKAYKDYSLVLKNNPPPELDFEATIYKAMLFMGTDKENQKVKKELNKMLKPTKYLDERDQIYYALAQIAVKEGDSSLSVKYLNKSVRASTTDARQKAISFLNLAYYNFNWENYPRSKKYFDSTLISLPKKYKGRDSIVAKKENLQKLVTYLDIITFQDSVQHLAKMDKKDLNKYIAKIIDDEKTAEAEKKQKEQEAKDNASLPGNNTGTAAANGKWYFYNPASLQQGMNEFNQKWGNRPLEDDWRRSKKIANANKMVQDSDEVKKSDLTEKSGKGGKKIVKDSLHDKYSSAYYLKNIPLTDAKMKKSVDSLIDAYYNAGAIYKEYLRNYRKSSAEFEELLSRFPDNKYKLLVYYELYRIYKDMHNDERMNFYKDLLLTKYPTTQYALLIKDPDKYARDRQASKEQITRLYTATLQSYKTENYLQVLNNCQQADSLFPENELTAKFAYLQAMAIGSTQGLDAYKNALTRVTILYPKDSVKFMAQSILNYLNHPKPKAVKDSNSITYVTREDSVYYWVMLVDMKDASKMPDMLAKLTDMNSKTFSQDNLKSEETVLNTNQLMIVMKKFNNLLDVKNYYQFLMVDDDIFKTLTLNTYQLFYISKQNYGLLLDHKKSDEYLNFFRGKVL